MKNDLDVKQEAQPVRANPRVEVVTILAMMEGLIFLFALIAAEAGWAGFVEVFFFGSALVVLSFSAGALWGTRHRALSAEAPKSALSQEEPPKTPE